MLIACFDCLMDVANVGWIKTKARILRKGDSPLLRELLYYAYAPTVRFGVGVVKYNNDAQPSGSYDSLSFLVLCNDLYTGYLQGSSAKDAVRRMIESYPPDYRLFLQDFFAQKLHLKLTPKDINSILPGCMPVFGLMLSRNYEPSRLNYPVFAAPKLAGMRALLYVDCKGILLWSKNGSVIRSIPSITNAAQHLPYGYYDGIIVHEDGGWNLLNAIIKHSINNLHPEAGNVTFHIYDFVSVSDWSRPTIQFKERLRQLQGIIDIHRQRNQSTPLRLANYTQTDTSIQLLKIHNTFSCQDQHEGTWIKGNIPYERKESFGFMHLKDFKTLEATVTGWEHGSRVGIYRNKMGKLLCRDNDTGLDFKVGMGFVPEDRDITDGWIGSVVLIKFDRWTVPSGRTIAQPLYPTYIKTLKHPGGN